MTLLEMKKKVLRLIEEINDKSKLLTDDPDIANKINDVINQIQNEIARIKKIPAKEELEVTKGDEIDFSDIAKDLFQINIVRGVENDIIGNTINFYGDGVAKIYYYNNRFYNCIYRFWFNKFLPIKKYRAQLHKFAKI